MRRSTFAVAAALALAVSATVHAQALTGQPANRPNGIARVMRASVVGIALTDSERTGLTAVRTRYLPRFKSIGDSVKPITATLRSAREAQDTAAAHAAQKQLQAQRQRAFATLRTALTDVRATLASNHRRRFDQNVRVISVLLAPGFNGPAAADR